MLRFGGASSLQPSLSPQYKTGDILFSPIVAGLVERGRKMRKSSNLYLTQTRHDFFDCTDSEQQVVESGFFVLYHLALMLLYFRLSTAFHA